jgi:hypothetical protein
MAFPSSWTGKEEMRPCNLNDHPSNLVKKVRDAVISRDPIDFQQYNEVMHIEAPSSMIVLPIMCFTYITLIWKST